MGVYHVPTSLVCFLLVRPWASNIQPAGYKAFTRRIAPMFASGVWYILRAN